MQYQYGGILQSRKGLPLETVTGMVRHTGRLICAKGSDTWLWRRRRVPLVDGTTVTLPDTQTNQTAYPQQRGQKPGLDFPICRIVGVTCLSSGVVLDAGHGLGTKAKASGEQALLRTLLDIFESGA